MVAFSKKIGWEIIKKITLPVLLLFLLIVGYIFYEAYLYPQIGAKDHASLKKYMATLFIFSVTFIIHRTVNAIMSWYEKNIAMATLTHLDDELIPIVRRTAKVVVWTIAFLVILPFYGVNISALIAALGVGSLAIALAAQDTIANIISGFLIMIDRPFRVGDMIQLPSGEVVEVLDIGVRRSRFLAENKAIIIVPNVDLSKSKIINFTYGKEREKQTPA